MKRLALRGLDSLSREAASENHYEAVLAQPGDFHPYMVDLPPLKEEDREGALKYRLRSLHPGDPEKTCVESRIPPEAEQTLSRRGGRVLCYAADRETVDAYRKRGLPILPGIALLEGGAQGGMLQVGILVAPQWTELAVFKDRELTQLLILPVLENVHWPAVATEISGGSSLENPSVFIVNLDQGSTSSASWVKTLTKELEPLKLKDIQALDAHKVLEGIDINRKSLFAIRKQGASPKRPFILTFLVVLSLLPVLYILDRLTFEEEKKAQEAKRAYEERKELALRGESLEKELSALEERSAALKKFGGPDIYGVLAELQHGLKGARLKSFILRDTAFTIEAEGSSALGVLERLKDTGAFREVILHQASPAAFGGDRFSISGYLNHD